MAVEVDDAAASVEAVEPPEAQAALLFKADRRGRSCLTQALGRGRGAFRTRDRWRGGRPDMA